MRFSYSAKNQKGSTVKGVVEADNSKSAAKILLEKKLTPITFSENKPMFDLSGFLAKFATSSVTEVANFTRQLATMITAGLPLTDALNLLKSQSPRPLAAALGLVLADVQSGVSLSDALSKHPRLFSRVYIALIKAGESAGVLEKVLNRLADSLEKSRDFESKVKGAMVYPAIVFIGMLVVMVVMTVVVIPKMTALYGEFGQELPLITSVIVAVSSFMASYWWLMALLIGAGFTGLRAYIQTPSGRASWDTMLYQLPIAGPLMQQTMLTQLTRTLSLLIGAGVSIVEALSICAAATGNLIVELELRKIAHQVEKGFPVSVSFSESEVFPIMMGQMIAVGEETGKLDEVLTRLSNYYETESESKVKTLTTAIEPLIIILLGLGVGFMIFAVIMPIYNLTNQF